MAQFTGMITCHDAHMPRRVLDALWQLPQWQPMASSQFPSLSFHFFFFLFQNPSPFPYGLLYRRDWNFAIIAEKGKKNEAFNHPRLVLIFSSFSPDWKPSLAFRDEFSLPRGNIFFAKFRSSRSAPLSVKKKNDFSYYKRPQKPLKTLRGVLLELFFSCCMRRKSKSDARWHQS